MKPLCESTRELLKPLSPNTSGELILSIRDEGEWMIEAHGVTVGTHRYSPDPILLGKIKHIPGSHSVQGNPYAYYMASGFVAFDILKSMIIASKVQLTFASTDAEWSWKIIEMHAALADVCAERVARWKLTKEVPPECLVLEEHPDRPLMDHQKICVRNNLDLPGYGNFLKMGTGKTPVAIATAMNMIRQRHETGDTSTLRMLVVCPNAVRQNWFEEFMAFSTRVGKVTICRGNEAGRIGRLAQGLSVDDAPGAQFTAVIVGLDTLPRMETYAAMVEWDLMVVDEAHTFVNGKTARCKAIQKVALKANRRLALTGSPIRNTPLDLYELIEFVSPGLSGFTSRKSWNDYYGHWVRGAGGFMSLEGMLNLPMLKENLARCSMIVSKDEVLQLPEKTYHVEEVELTDRQREVYKQVVDQLAVEIEGSLSGADGPNRSMIIQNILVKMLRLSQVTGGFINWPAVCDPETGVVLTPAQTEYFPTSPKIQRLMELLLDEDREPGSKCIVWCHHLAELRWVAATLEANGVEFVEYYGEVNERDRQIAVDRYNNDPTVKVFLATQGAGGTGLNLLGYNSKSTNPIDCNTTDEYFMSQGWSSIIREQAEDRGHRKGARSSVRITTIVVPGSIDMQIERRLRQKKEVSNETQDVRELLKLLLGETPE